MKKGFILTPRARHAARDPRSDTSGRAVKNDLEAAESLARDLVAKLTMIEERLMVQARLSRRAAG